jgi:hypothetical protein
MTPAPKPAVVGYDRTVHPGQWHQYHAQEDGTERCRCGATLYPVT